MPRRSRGARPEGRPPEPFGYQDHRKVLRRLLEGPSALSVRASWPARLEICLSSPTRLPISGHARQARFTNLVHGTWLAEVSETSYNQGITGLPWGGPAGPVAAKLVRVSFLDPVYRGEVMMAGVHWEATGAAGGLFPALDATISSCPTEQTNTAVTSPAPWHPARRVGPSLRLASGAGDALGAGP